MAAIRDRVPGVSVEVLISDCKGDPDALGVIFDIRPEVLNHNVETVPRLQRAARPSASYARSLAVLARAKQAGLTTKTSLIVGMGETREEVVGTMADLHGVGVDIVTIGQYLRPTTNHLPVARWWTPDELTELKELGEALGIGHVEASPLTAQQLPRSSSSRLRSGGTVAPMTTRVVTTLFDGGGFFEGPRWRRHLVGVGFLPTHRFTGGTGWHRDRGGGSSRSAIRFGMDARRCAGDLVHEGPPRSAISRRLAQ